MKPEQIYQELKDLAEKLEITVSEQNLRTAGIKVKSGLCKVKGKNLFVMDGACYVTIGCVNPTLTMMSLALRSSEYLVEQAKKGELS